MTTVLAIADAFRATLVPFLRGAAVVLIGMLILLCVQRMVGNALKARRARLANRFRADVDQALDGSTGGAPARLVRAARWHRQPIAAQLLATLRSLSGPAVSRGRDLARATGLSRRWRRDLERGRWYRRAEAARALGLIAESEAFDELVELLDDPHHEVRAAAVEALGKLDDVRAVPPLLDALHAKAGHQRVRIVDALARIGQPAGPLVLEYVRGHVDALPELGELLAITCGATASDDLLNWCSLDDPAGRAAAIQSLGTIGISDRGFYFVLRGLGDSDGSVRAAAARALGRSGRADAATYLAGCLDDEWDVAATGARSLGQLAAAGRAELDRLEKGSGQSADLARQVLFELRLRAAH